jgi:hypothetical protein
MKPILKWQYDQIVKELLLLQEHQEDPTCPCDSGGEMCTRKHLMTVEAYAEETRSIEKDDEQRMVLADLAKQARERREQEEKALCKEDVPPSDLLDWTRDWRKKFEALSLACESGEDENEEDEDEK